MHKYIINKSNLLSNPRTFIENGCDGRAIYNRDFVVMDENWAIEEPILEESVDKVGIIVSTLEDFDHMYNILKEDIERHYDDSPQKIYNSMRQWFEETGSVVFCYLSPNAVFWWWGCKYNEHIFNHLKSNHRLPISMDDFKDMISQFPNTKKIKRRGQV